MEKDYKNTAESYTEWFIYITKPVVYEVNISGKKEIRIYQTNGKTTDAIDEKLKELKQNYVCITNVDEIKKLLLPLLTEKLKERKISLTPEGQALSIMSLDLVKSCEQLQELKKMDLSELLISYDIKPKQPYSLIPLFIKSQPKTLKP